MTGAQSDCELLAAHLGGDARAFEELAGRHARMVLGVCRRVLGSGPDAEDAAQAAFVVLAQKGRGLVGGAGDLGAWLHRTAALVARTALRDRRTRARHEKEAAAMRRENGQGGEADRLWREHETKLDAALDALPAGSRRALLLCYFEGLSQSEAARKLAVPEGTVAKQCARGLSWLREKLGVRDRSLGAAALAALILERSGGALPANFLPSVVAAAKGAAASAPVLALVKGALQVMFWTKVKLAAAAVAAAAVLAIGTPLAVRALSGEGGSKPPVAQPAPANPVAERKDDPPVVNGLSVSLTAAPASLVCGDECRKKLNLGNGVLKCACGRQVCNAAHKTCWDCAYAAGACEVCGAKLPGGGSAVAGLEAGQTVRLVLAFENVSAEKLRICDYLLQIQKVRWEVSGPDKESVRIAPTGVQFMLAAITEANFPELAPGARHIFSVALGGNPPAVNQGATVTYLLKPGAYKIAASYRNQEDSYFDNQLKQKVQPPGKIWKGEIKSGVLELKVTGAVQPPPAQRPLFAN